MKLGKYLTKNKIKPADFAKLVDCSDSMVRRIVLYGQRPGVELAVRIEIQTDGQVTADELIGLDEARKAAA